MLTKIDGYSPRKAFCKHPDHDPPKMIVLPSGQYVHECPGCGTKKFFEVKSASMVKVR